MTSGGTTGTHALIYLRISTDKREEAGVDRQRETNLRVAREGGATTFTVFTDNDISASKPDLIRPDFQRMLTAIAQGEADDGMIVSWGLDRAVRQGIEFEQFLLQLDMHRIRFIAPADGLDRRPGDSDFIARVRAAMAAEEIHKLRTRINLSLEQNRQRGKRHGPLPYGWNRDGSAKPDEAAVVREVTDRLLAGDTTLAIARDLNERGVPGKTWVKRSEKGVKLSVEDQVERVTPWTRVNIRELAARPANAGLMVHRQEIMPGLVASWEPLVPEDRWRALQGLLASRKRPASVRRHLLSGLITCGECPRNARVHGYTQVSQRKYVNLYYKCSRTAECTQRIRLPEVDAYVNQTMIERLSAITLPDLASDRRKEAMRAASDQLEALRVRLAETDEMLAEGEINRESYLRITAKIRPMLAEAEAEVERLSDGRTEVLRGLTGNAAVDGWNDCSDDRKRAVIALLATVTLLPGTRTTEVEDRIRIEWNEL